MLDEYKCLNDLLHLGYPVITKEIYSHEKDILITLTKILIVGVESLCQDMN